MEEDREGLAASAWSFWDAWIEVERTEYGGASLRKGSINSTGLRVWLQMIEVLSSAPSTPKKKRRGREEEEKGRYGIKRIKEKPGLRRIEAKEKKKKE
jgi:hypothetical protein